MGQLQKVRLTPAPVFSKVGVDYAGPLLLKTGYTRKHVLKKAYVCVFVCIAVKVVHLELVAELTTEAFIATFCLLPDVAVLQTSSETMAPIFFEQIDN